MTHKEKSSGYRGLVPRERCYRWRTLDMGYRIVIALQQGAKTAEELEALVGPRARARIGELRADGLDIRTIFFKGWGDSGDCRARKTLYVLVALPVFCVSDSGIKTDSDLGEQPGT